MMRRQIDCAVERTVRRGIGYDWRRTPQTALDQRPVYNFKKLTEQHFVLIPCTDEKQPIELLTRFQHEGLECRALLS